MGNIRKIDSTIGSIIQQLGKRNSDGTFRHGEFWQFLTDTDKYAIDHTLPITFDIQSAIKEHVYRKRKIDVPETEAKSYVKMYWASRRKAGTHNTRQHDYLLVISVQCHTTLCDVLDKNESGHYIVNQRPNILIDILEEILPTIAVDSIRGKMVAVSEWGEANDTDDFQGYTALYSFTQDVM